MWGIIRELTRRPLLWAGVLVAVATALVLSLLLGLALYLTPLPEAYLESYALAILAVGVFGGGFFAARSARSYGLIHGLSVAAVVIALMVLVTWLGPFEFSPTLLTKSGLTALVAGILGGIVGVSW